MAKAADFDGKANETEVVTSESVKGKRKTSILGTKARLWLITINNPQNHGISLEQSGILERFKEDIKTGRVTYVASVMEQSLTVDENDKHTPHGHIAAYFPSQELGGHLHKLFPMAALQDCKANILSVRQYLIKDPTGAWYKKYPEKFGEKLPDDEANFWEWGIIPDGRRKSADSQSSKTLSEDVLQAIREGKNDAEILTKFPTVWNRSAELRKIRFAIMSQKYRPIYRDLNCIYVEANFPPKEAYKLFAHTPDTYVVSDYTHPWDSYCAEKTVVLTEYAIVLEVVRKVFAQIKDTPYSRVAEQRIRQESNLQKVKRAAIEKKMRSAQHALERFEGEILKCLDGTSCFTEDMIAKQIRKSQKDLDDAKAEFAELQKERINEAAEIRKLRSYYDDFRGWADEFDSAPLKIKRTILSQLIDRVEVGRKYAVTIKFNMSYQQFLECDKTIEPRQEIGA